VHQAEAHFASTEDINGVWTKLGTQIVQTGTGQGEEALPAEKGVLKKQPFERLVIERF
jgi:hypothetical protein